MGHLIEKISFETICNSKKLGSSVEQEVSDLLQNELIQRLEQILDDYCPADYLWTIGSISVNLNNLGVSNWKEELVRLTAEQVEDYLKKNAIAISNNPDFISSGALAGELLLYYIDTGIIKKNALYNTLAEIEEAFTQTIFNTIRQKLVAKLTGNERAQIRFICNTGTHIKSFLFMDTLYLKNFYAGIINDFSSYSQNFKNFSELFLLNIYFLQEGITLTSPTLLANINQKYFPGSLTMFPILHNRIKRYLKDIPNANSMLQLWEDAMQQGSVIETYIEVRRDNEKKQNSVREEANGNVIKSSEREQQQRQEIKEEKSNHIKSEDNTEFPEDKPEKNNKDDEDEDKFGNKFVELHTSDILKDNNVNNKENIPTTEENKPDGKLDKLNISNNTESAGSGSNTVSKQNGLNNIESQENNDIDKIEIKRDRALSSNGSESFKTGEEELQNIIPKNPDYPGNSAENIEKEEFVISEEIKKQVVLAELPDWIYINNSGLVILAPFLNELFKNAGLLNDKEWKSFAHHQKAVLLTQYLVTGKIHFVEYELIFNKLLCGFYLTDVIDTQTEITENDLHLCDELLVTVIQYWSILKNTSPEGLREAFLMREGKLNFTKSAPELWVEQKAIDILLGKLPWNMAMTKTPWMDNFLFTTWA